MESVSSIIASEIESLRGEEVRLNGLTQSIRNATVLCLGGNMFCPDADMMRVTYLPLLDDINDFLQRLIILHVQDVNIETRAFLTKVLPDFASIRKELRHCALIIGGWKQLYEPGDDGGHGFPPVDSPSPLQALQTSYDVPA